MDMSWLKDYVEQQIVSKTTVAFVVFMIVACWRPDVVDKSTVAMIGAFFFGAKAVQSGVASQKP